MLILPVEEAWERKKKIVISIYFLKIFILFFGEGGGGPCSSRL